MADSPIALLLQWLKRSRESQFAHYSAAERCSQRHLWIGIPAASFSAIVGTTIFSALDTKDSLDLKFKVGIALVSIVTAILTGCQTFLRFSEKADGHRNAAGKFSGLRRKIEVMLSFPDSINYSAVEALRKELDDISSSSPTVSDRIWKEAMQKAGGEYLFSNHSS